MGFLTAPLAEFNLRQMPLRKKKAMRVHIKDGTAGDGVTKCASCTHSHIIRGFRESEELVFCDFASNLIRIPFKVRECTNHQDRSRPDWEQMEKLAIDVQPLTSAKPAGFRLVSDGEKDEAAAVIEIPGAE